MPAPLRFLPAILVLACLAPAAHAQGFAGGLRMGTSVFTLRSDSPIDLSPAIGLAGGLWLEMPLAGGLSFQPELNYLTAGAHGKARAEVVFGPDQSVDPDQLVRLRFTYTYLQIPALVAWEPSLRRTFTPRLFAGPYVAFKQDAYVRFGPEDGDLSASEIDDAVRSRDYGVAFGGHVSMDTGNFGRFALGAEASVGLADLRDSEVRTTNLGVMLFVGLVF